MIGELTNHIWQSTIFAGVAGLMTLGFRKSRAHVRYWLWLSASLKFLLPFSLLIGLGSRLEWAPATQKIAAASAVAFTVVQMSQPFAGEVPLAPGRQDTRDRATIVILGVWVCGLFTIVLIRWRGWRRIRAAVRSSTPLAIPATIAIEIRSSPGLLEPGVVGLFRPTLLFPAGIVDRLKPTQLEAVLAHELCHVRRRDNLTSAVHMVVEAVFWFHPMVWWIGARLLEERERACDEAVLSLGNQPHDYAEGILNVCMNYLESPLSCVAGVTGSDLKKRIQAILTGDAPGGLNLAKKSILGMAGMVAVAVPIVVGIISASHVRAQSQRGDARSAGAITPRFEVASIKRNMYAWSDPLRHAMGVRMEPGGLRAQNAPVMLLIQRAYAVQAFQVAQGPAWMNTERYDVEAKAERGSDQKQVWVMLQTLLADRFRLRLHRETREMPVYDLMVAKGGSKLPAAKAVDCVSRPPGAPPTPPAAGQTDCGYVAGPSGRTKLLRLQGSKVQIAGLINKLALVMGRPVVDKTEFTGDFDLDLSFTADEATMGMPGMGGPGDPNPGGPRIATDPSRPNIFAALEEQLGLKLVAANGLVDVLVIDHVERPSAN